MYVHRVFDKLIWHTIGPKSFLFAIAQFSLWARCVVNYDYIVANSISSLLIGSRCVPNGAHTNYCWANLAHASKHIKNSTVYVCECVCDSQSHPFIHNTSILIMFYPVWVMLWLLDQWHPHSGVASCQL